MTSKQFKCDRDMLTRNDDGRRTGPARLLCVHTSEGSWQKMTADNLGAYLQRPESGGSYHVVIDAAGRTVRSNDDAFIPWAAMYTGNRVALHVCLVGTAGFTREQWLERTDQLDALGRWLRHAGQQYNIPMTRLIGSAIKPSTVRGVCGHGDVSAAWAESDHWDPGPDFPYDYFTERKPDPEPTKHIVQAGETLTAIARRYGTTVAKLATVNSLDDPNRIRVAQVLRLPR